MTWKLDTYKYAGHKVTIRYSPWKDEIRARIKGPRASSIDKKRYANDIKWKLESRIPFMSPSTSKVDDKIFEIYKQAKKEIDNAIAAHHKKRDDQYQ